LVGWPQYGRKVDQCGTVTSERVLTGRTVDAASGVPRALPGILIEV